MDSLKSPIEELESFLQGEPALFFEEINSHGLINILDYVSLAKRCGYNFARKVGKQKNKQFIDECQAEALFWLFILFHENFWEIMWQESAEAYIRMKLSYKLKEYWSSRDSLSLTYYKQRGKQIATHGRINRRDGLERSTVHMNMYENGVDDLDNEKFYSTLCEQNLETLESDILDDVLRDGTDARILTLYCENLPIWIIALEIQKSSEFVHKTLTRIERGILNASH